MRIFTSCARSLPKARGGKSLAEVFYSGGGQGRPEHRPPHPAILRIVRAKLIFPYLMLAAALVEGVAAGQSANGYLNVGVGSNSGSADSEFAAGGEVVFGRTVGIGGEIGVLLRHSGFGFASVDGSVHLLRSAGNGRFDPFLTGGYTRAFDIFSGANGANFGAGFNYWLTHHFGVRAEFRDLVFSSGSPTVNYWVIRGGIAFR
jgi:hypothetical protein